MLISMENLSNISMIIFAVVQLDSALDMSLEMYWNVGNKTDSCKTAGTMV